MSSTREKVRQLAPHWAAMFLLMVATLSPVERVAGRPGLLASAGIVVAVAIGYPHTARALGVAPPVWRRS